jgi:hypothetical protein
MPAEVRYGGAEMVITAVEQDVSRDEITHAVETLIATAPVCASWPTLWLEEGGRRTQFTVRLDLMARDWGEEVASESRARMREFVELGFLTEREGSRGAVEYLVTPVGAPHLRDSPLAGRARDAFCSPVERRLVEIKALEWGQFPCGTLRVRFTHTADDWPSWARTEASRRRVTEAAAPVGVVADGMVSLSRQWYRADGVPTGRRNGELRSVCYDPVRERELGDDLQLRANPPASAPAEEEER